MDISIIIASLHEFIIEVHCFPIIIIRNNIKVTCNLHYGIRSKRYLSMFWDHVCVNTSCHILKESRLIQNLFSSSNESNLEVFVLPIESLCKIIRIITCFWATVCGRGFYLRLIAEPGLIILFFEFKFYIIILILYFKCIYIVKISIMIKLKSKINQMLMSLSCLWNDSWVWCPKMFWGSVMRRCWWYEVSLIIRTIYLT